METQSFLFWVEETIINSFKKEPLEEKHVAHKRNKQLHCAGPYCLNSGPQTCVHQILLTILLVLIKQLNNNNYYYQESNFKIRWIEYWFNHSYH